MGGGGAGGVSKIRTETAQVLEGSGAGKLSWSAAAGGGNTWVFASDAADEAGAGGCHGAKIGEMERVADRRGNPAGKSSGKGGSEGAARPPEWRKPPGRIAREWEGELSRQGALKPLKWKSFPRGAKPPE